MEHLYNPDQMPEQEIKDTFVARQALVGRLVSMVERQPDGAGVQHIVIVAPRGMGKTTILLMVQFAVRDKGLAPPWLPIRFPEELYGVIDLADFWLETLESVAAEMEDTALSDEIARIKRDYRDPGQMEGAAAALLRSWCSRNGRRLILLVDNFNAVLKNLGDEQQNAALRNVLMNEGWLMVIGAAPSYFKEASDYDVPLYNFFRIEQLERLTPQEVEDLLCRRAAADGNDRFDEFLKANATRLRVLEYFTNGNARLVLMVYRVIARSEVEEVRRELELLLDQATPYFQARTELLPRQQQKILDFIARRSGETNVAVSPSEIGEGVRLPAQTVSGQLVRLAESGYVQRAEQRGRKTYYTLAEPLYSLWYQMRFGRNARQKMAWLVSFLKGFYTIEELGEQYRELGERFTLMNVNGMEREARAALEHRRWIVEAMDEHIRIVALEGVIKGYLDLQELTTLKEIIPSGAELSRLSPGLLNRLRSADCITDVQLTEALGEPTTEKNTDKTPSQLLSLLDKSKEAFDRRDYLAALASIDEATKYDELSESGWAYRGLLLTLLDRHLEALASFDEALTRNDHDASIWQHRGDALCVLGRYEEALADYDKALSLEGHNATVWHDHGKVLLELGRYEDAVVSYDRAISIDNTDPGIWFSRGWALYDGRQYVDALASYDRGIELDAGRAYGWGGRGVVLRKLGRYADALVSFDRVLELDENDVDGWQQRGWVLFELRRDEESLASFDRALDIDNNSAYTWYSRSFALASMERYYDALTALSTAIDLLPGDAHEKLLACRLQRFTVFLTTLQFDHAEAEWLSAVEVAREVQDFPEAASNLLIRVALGSKPGFVRHLISRSNTEKEFFPLARAIDYVESGDESLIETLTPEMRPIVLDVVKMIKPDAAPKVIGAPKRRRRK